MKKIAYVATVPDAIYTFMRFHIQEISQTMNVIIVSNNKRSDILETLPSIFFEVDFNRKISLVKDFRSLISLIKIFNREKPDILHTIMPKTGMLGMLGGWLTGVPFRVHTFTGQVWVNKSGFKREFLKLFDWLIVQLATIIIVDSHSQRNFLISEGVLKKTQGVVILNGSICGVDASRFKPDAIQRKLIRKQLQLKENDFFILFLGRLSKDKGILDLVIAFNELVSEGQKLILGIIGPEDDISFREIQLACGDAYEHLRRVDFTLSPENYMAAADIMCLPSYREGFNQVILEAASSGIPSVASRIYGVTDFIENGKTGLLFTPGNIEELKKSILKLITNPQLRFELGNNARLHAIDQFSSHSITKELCEIYGKSSN